MKIKRQWPLAVMALLAAGQVRAQESLESISALPMAGLSALKPPPASPGFQPMGMIRDRIRQTLRDTVFPLSAKSTTPIPSSPVAARLTVEELLNRHWKSDLVFPLGVEKAFVSGSFSREQNAYLSAYAPGWDKPRFFNIADLSERPGRLHIGPSPFRGPTYSVYLKIALFNPPASRFVFQNEADGSDAHDTTFKNLFDSIYATGRPLKLSDQTYQVFLGNEVKEGPDGPVLDEERRTLGLLFKEGDKLQAFLIALENLTADKAAVFSLHNGKKVAVTLSGGTLSLFEVPN